MSVANPNEVRPLKDTQSKCGKIDFYKHLPKYYRIIFISYGGSKLYGTATENSDTDYKVVYIPSWEDIILGQVMPSFSYKTANANAKNTKDDVDIEYKSIYDYLELLRKGDTMGIDLAFADTSPSAVLFKNRLWDKYIIQNRGKFLSKNFKSFTGFAKDQAYRYGVKGDKLKVIEQILEVFDNNKTCERLSGFWHLLPVTKHSTFIGLNDNGIKQYQICDKILQESTTWDYSVDIIQGLKKRYGKRAKQAMINNGSDWKALSHALRACYEVKELMLTGGVQFPLADADFIRDVKTGKYDYKYIVSLLERD